MKMNQNARVVTVFLFALVFPFLNATADPIVLKAVSYGAHGGPGLGSVEFIRDGETVHHALGGSGLGRGWYIWVVNLETGESPPIQKFDPWGNRADLPRLTAYLRSIELNSLCTLAICDEGGLTRWDSCAFYDEPEVEEFLAELENLGAEKIRNLCYRDSYSLAVVVGDERPLAESLGRWQSAEVAISVEFGTGLPPHIFRQPQSQHAMLGTEVIFHAGAVSHLPATSQWFKGDVALVGATTPSLTLRNVSDSDAGEYSVEFRNVNGSRRSETVHLGIQSSPVVGSVDQEFIVDESLPGPFVVHELLQQGNKWIVALSPVDDDYQISNNTPGYVAFSGGYGPERLVIARLLADGTRDPAFQPWVSSGAAYSLAVDAVGGVLVGTGNKREPTGLTRLHPTTGEVDIDFNVTIDWQGSSPEYGAWVDDIQVDSKGMVYIAGHFSSVNGLPRWGIARLLPDGAVDETWAPAISHGSVAAMDLLDDGRVILVSGASLPQRAGEDALKVWSVTSRHILIIDERGNIDLSFQDQLGFTLPRRASHGAVKEIKRVPGGYVLVGHNLKTVGQTAGDQVVWLSEDGTVIGRFRGGSDVLAGTAQRDGSVILAGRFHELGGEPRNYLASIRRDGSVEPLLNLSEPPNSPVTRIALGDDNSVLMAGLFTEIGRIQRANLARIVGRPVSRESGPVLMIKSGALDAGQLSIEISDLDAGTHHLRASVDGSVFFPLDPPFDFDRGTRFPVSFPINSDERRKLFQIWSGASQSPRQEHITLPLEEDFENGNGGFVSSTFNPASASDTGGKWIFNPGGVDGSGAWSAAGARGNAPFEHHLTTPHLVVPTDGLVTLSFDHRFDFERAWDGGIVMISVNDGPFEVVSEISQGGYNVTLQEEADYGYPGDLNGVRVFSGASDGFIRTVANLGTHREGDTLRLRWVGMWDWGTLAPLGWSLENVQVRRNK